MSADESDILISPVTNEMFSLTSCLYLLVALEHMFCKFAYSINAIFFFCLFYEYCVLTYYSFAYCIVGSSYIWMLSDSLYPITGCNSDSNLNSSFNSCHKLKFNKQQLYKQGLWALLESDRHDSYSIFFCQMLIMFCGPHSLFSSLLRLSEARTFYSYALQRLPGVVRTGKPQIPITDLIKNSTVEWRPFNKLVQTSWHNQPLSHLSLKIVHSFHIYS